MVFNLNLNELIYDSVYCNMICGMEDARSSRRGRLYLYKQPRGID